MGSALCLGLALAFEVDPVYTAAPMAVMVGGVIKVRERKFKKAMTPAPKMERLPAAEDE